MFKHWLQGLFIENPKNYKFVFHKDGNKLNNHVSNLQWSPHKLLERRGTPHRLELREHRIRERNEIQNQTLNKKEQEYKIIVNEYIYGKPPQTLRSLSKKYNTSAGLIAKWVVSLGYETRKHPNKKPKAFNPNRGTRKDGHFKLDAQTRHDAVMDYVNGRDSLHNTAAKYNMTGKALKRWVVKEGHKIRPLSGWRDWDKINSIISDFIDGETIESLSLKYDVCQRTIYDYLKSKNIPYQKRKGLFHAIKSIVTTKFGDIKADSNYEKHRILQHVKNNTIKNLSRCNIKIPYIDNDGISRNYHPDFMILTYDGEKIIEDVKPHGLVDKGKNPFKFKAALAYCLQNNISFKIATEYDIYGGKKGYVRKEDLKAQHNIAA